MRHFAHLTEGELARLFGRRPESFDRDSDAGVLATALGATLYLPGTRPTLATDLAKRARRGVVSAVVCLEDAVGDADVGAAERNTVAALREYAEHAPDGPLVFVRVRTPQQIPVVLGGLGAAATLLSGFVVPKFTEESGPAFLDAVADADALLGRRTFVMPVIESPEVIHRESRLDALLGIQRLLDKHRERVLAVRIGATDLAAAFGIRRDRDLTVYDVRPVADAIGDVVNVLGRADGTGYVITGPVWEYFHRHERMFKPLLRQSPFDEHDARRLRQELITGDLDGLIREIVLDKANGLTGKTVIHPSHVGAVHALSVVTAEEYDDARDIVGRGGGGATTSSRRNKMNESKPHRAWAERMLRRAAVFGVAAEGVSFVDLLAAGAAA